MLKIYNNREEFLSEHHDDIARVFNMQDFDQYYPNGAVKFALLSSANGVWMQLQALHPDGRIECLVDFDDYAPPQQTVCAIEIPGRTVLCGPDKAGGVWVDDLDNPNEPIYLKL